MSAFINDYKLFK